MSGTNPFRRNDSKTAGLDSISNKGEGGLQSKISAHVPHIETDTAKQTKTKAGKTVRIISPQPLSSDTDDSDDQPDWAIPRAFSPPPRVSSLSSDDSVSPDPFTHQLLDNSNDEENLETKRNTAANVTQSNEHIAQVPYNPFKGSQPPLQGPTTTGNERAATANHEQKPQYDVAAFTKLLLTGEQSKNESSTTAPPVTFKQNDPVHDGAGEVPNAYNTGQLSSTNASRSAVYSSAVLDDQRQKSGITVQGETLRQKPNTPTHRHGKVVKTNAPLTVSFADPSLSSSETNDTLDPGPRKPGDSINALQQGALADSVSTPKTKRASPAPPTQSNVHGDSQASSKKTAPAPPPSRRHGLARSRSSGMEPNVSASITESEDAADAPVASSPVPLHHKPKPPPPRRNASVRRDSSSSIVNTSSTAASPDSLTRSPSNTASNRPLSSISHSSTTAVPPVPPPRRRGSSQSSYTPSRLSGDYRQMMAQRSRADSGASSISQFQMPSVESPAAQQARQEIKDPMADLSALQRELDEYRKNVGR